MAPSFPQLRHHKTSGTLNSNPEKYSSTSNAYELAVLPTERLLRLFFYMNYALRTGEYRTSAEDFAQMLIVVPAGDVS